MEPNFSNFWLEDIINQVITQLPAKSIVVFQLTDRNIYRVLRPLIEKSKLIYLELQGIQQWFCVKQRISDQRCYSPNNFTNIYVGGKITGNEINAVKLHKKVQAPQSHKIFTLKMKLGGTKKFMQDEEDDVKIIYTKVKKIRLASCNMPIEHRQLEKPLTLAIELLNDFFSSRTTLQVQSSIQVESLRAV